MCVCERERETKRDRERQTDRETDRYRDREWVSMCMNVYVEVGWG